MTKQCLDCGCEKPQSDFYKSSNGKNGLAAYCKPCHNLRGRKARGTADRVKEVLPAGQARCGRCQQVKPEPQFYVNQNGRRTQCKACSNELTRRYQRTDEGKKNLKQAHLLRQYGITLEQYAELWCAQQGLCAICEVDLRIIQPHLDHCHKTKIVRGILCNNCNLGLGLFKDNAKVLSSASVYLLKHQMQ